MTTCFGRLFLFLGICSLFSLTAWAQTAPGPQANQHVAFLGDSITAAGWDKPTGFIHLVEIAMKQQGRPIVAIPAGSGGNASDDMLARLDGDVLSKKPEWMVLSCGVNDVARPTGGVPLEAFKKNITSIVDQATAAGVKVVILTATMIWEDPNTGNNQKLVGYNDFLRSLAQKDHLLLADLNAAMQAEVAKGPAIAKNKNGNLLTIDGIHMNGVGDEMMAAGILKAFGFTPAQLNQARQTWLDLPGAEILTPQSSVTCRQFLQLQALAASQKRSVDDVANDALSLGLRDMLSKSPPLK